MENVSQLHLSEFKSLGLNLIRHTVREEFEQSQIATVIDYYTNSLRQHKKALSYIKDKRKLSDETIKHFRLGFVDRTLGKVLGESRKTTSAIMRGTLERIGFTKSSGHERFRGSIVFPTIVDGIVLGAYGRRISANVSGDSRPYPYTQALQSYFFNQDCLKEYSGIVLCKSPMEVVSAWQLGIKNVISLVGQLTLSPSHLNILNNNHVKHVCLALCGQRKFNKNTEAIAKLLQENEISTSVLVLPDNSDINGLMCKSSEAHLVLLQVMAHLSILNTKNMENYNECQK